MRQDLYKFELMCFFYKHKLNDNFLEKFHLERNLTQRINCETGEFRVPFPRINSSKFNFRYQMPKLWNELPQEIKDISNFSKFKKALRTDLLNSYI